MSLLAHIRVKECCSRTDSNSVPDIRMMRVRV